MSRAPKLSSGIELVDETWGGFYRGGSYLVYGRSANDRALIPALFAGSTGSPEPCVYLSSNNIQEALSHTRRFGVDLERQQNVSLEELPRSNDLRELDDDRLSSTLSDVVARIESTRPERAIFDDFMPFIQFHSFGRFREAFIDMLKRIDATDATLLLVMAEPANKESESVITFMRKQMTGALHIDRPHEDGRSTIRRMAFLPNIGHIGQDADREWDIRKWMERTSPAGQTDRRFRFAEEFEGAPSPRSARWEDDGGPSVVPSIRLGGRPANSAAPSERTAEQGTPPAPRIPRIPLGNTGRQSASVASRRDEPARMRSVGGPPTPAPATGGGVAPMPLYQSATEQNPQEKAGLVTLTRDAPRRSSHTDREAFRSRLQHEFLRQDVDQTPFLLIAMRMDRPYDDQTQPFDFDVILDLVSESLRDQDNVLVEPERERLIVMLAQTGPEAAQPFFARLKQQLHEETPHQADYLMRAVSAIVVPNGEPFRTAEEFLAYALDEV